MYAAQVSRPDLCFAVGMLSKLKNNAGTTHWSAVRYMKGTASMKLEFSNVINPVQKHCLKDYKELPNIVNAVR